MSLLSKGLDLLSTRLGLKRGRAGSVEAAPGASQGSLSTEEAAVEGLGRCSLHTDGSSEGASALKRCRVSKADPSAAGAAPPGFACKVGAAASAPGTATWVLRCPAPT